MPGAHTARTALAAAAAVLLAGCASAPEEAASPAGVPASPAATSTSASPSPTLTPSPTATPLPKARNGTRLRACRDATCEVLVSDGQTIRLADRWGLMPINVTVEDGSVTFHASTASGMQLTMSKQTPDQGGPSTVNEVSFEVVAVKGRKAVIKITH
jgi:type IV pilus biogenesis protein CpaD/CtpE